MVYSAWKILFSIFNDMVTSNNKTPFEKQWNLLRDMSVLTKPHVLKEEGFPVILAKSFTGSSQRGIYIFSLGELEIGRPYITRGDTYLVRASDGEIQMGEIFSSDQNGLVTIRIPCLEEMTNRTYRPTISGTLMKEIMLLALEQFTHKKLSDGFFFYELASGDLQFGRSIKSLEELSPNTTYISEDYSVKLKRRFGGKFSFFFAGYNLMPNTHGKEEDASCAEPIEASSVTIEEATETTSLEAVETEKKEPEAAVPQPSATPVSLSEDLSTLLKEIDDDVEQMPLPQPIESAAPPPPPGIPLPPPPPLPSLAKKCATPKRRMRPLRWSAIPRHQLDATIWGQNKSPVNNNSGSRFSVREKDVEKLFSVSPINSPAKPVARGKSRRKPSLLPLKRANNISVVISRLPSVEVIRASILLECDSQLTLDQLSSLSGILPLTDDDITAVRCSRRQETELSKAELFVKEMSDVPRLSQKVDCLRFMRQLAEISEEVSPQMKTIVRACHEAKNSRSLRHVLQLILEVGSILNRDTYLSSRGFRLQSLQSLAETRAKGGRVTLVHYLAKLIEEADPSLLHFEANELPHCHEASKIPMDAMLVRVQEVSEQMECVENELRDLETDKENQGTVDCAKFAATLTRFHKEAQQKVNYLKQLADTAKQLFADVSVYFGEDSSEITPAQSADFFSTIHHFSHLLLTTQKDGQAVKVMQQLVHADSPVSSTGDVSLPQAE